METLLRRVPVRSYIMLVRGTSIMAKAIQKATGSPYSHCGFVFTALDKQGSLVAHTVEADVGGVLTRPFDTYPWKADLFYLPDMTVEQEALLRKWALSKLGTPYDYGKVIGTGLNLLFKWAWARPLLDCRKAFHCAEFVQAGLELVGHKLDTPETEITPARLCQEKSLVLLAPKLFSTGGADV